MSLRYFVRPALLRNLISLIVVAALLAACSAGGDEPDPEPTPIPTEIPPTAVPGALSVEEFTNRINIAWGEVTSLRVTSSSGAVPIESTSGTPATRGTSTIEEWSAPHDRRITEYVDGTVINEQVYVDEVIYMRGLFVGTAVAPEVGSGTWIILDQSIVPTDTPVGNRIRYLTREASAPFENLSPDLLPLPVTENGTVRVGDRSCTLYTFGDPDNTGESIRYEVALDENDLPCQVVMRGGGFQNSSIYEINSGDVEIVAPLEGTPVSGTPEG